MLFSSLSFLFLFCPLFLFFFFLTPPKHRPYTLILGSLVFYAFGDIRGLPVLLLFTLISYFSARLAEKSTFGIFLSASVLIGLLAFYKYITELPMPLGLSFYGFTAISFVIDARLKKKKGIRLSDFSAELLMFPKLISGPIARQGTLKPFSPNASDAAHGIRRFVCGFAKKMLLASPSMALWEELRTMPTADRGMLGTLAGLVFYAFYLYFDFSGYTDMAIGIGRILGYSLPENFNYPYTATSARDFWRRWHITLSLFFRDYVYIPLGGSRRGMARTLLNLLAVWLLTGLWHGSTLNFLLWGLFWFLLLTLERLFLGRLLDQLPRLPARLYTLLAVLISWWFFAFPDLSEGLAYLAGLAQAPVIGDMARYELVRNGLLAVVLTVGATPLPKKLFDKWGTIPKTLAPISAFFIALAYLVASGYQPFLYFQF